MRNKYSDPLITSFISPSLNPQPYMSSFTTKSMLSRKKLFLLSRKKLFGRTARSRVNYSAERNDIDTLRSNSRLRSDNEKIDSNLSDLKLDINIMPGTGVIALLIVNFVNPSCEEDSGWPRVITPFLLPKITHLPQFQGELKESLYWGTYWPHFRLGIYARGGMSSYFWHGKDNAILFDERHLDLSCWWILVANYMNSVSKLFTGVKNLAKEYGSMDKLLSEFELLNQVLQQLTEAIARYYGHGNYNGRGHRHDES